MSAFIIGGTGLVGSNIVKKLEASSDVSTILTLGRRSIEGSKIKSIVEKDISAWPELIKTNAATSNIFISAFGSTRAEAGGLENFKKIDIDTNINGAKAAKEAGVETYILVSTMGANKSSMFPYFRLKGELEDAVIELGFKKTIILRPGILLGERTKSKGFMNNVASFVGSTFRNCGLFVSKATEAEEIATVALKLAFKEVDNNEKVQIIESADIVKLAK